MSKSQGSIGMNLLISIIMARITWSLCWVHFVLALTVNASVVHVDFKDRCLAFKPQTHVPNSSLNQLEYVSAGKTIAFPDNDPSCNRASQAVNVDLCRVVLSVPTSNRSSIVYELWLPETWNGRTLATGNGGLDGCIKYEDIAYGAANGFSTFGSNNGHNGTSGNAFYQNEDTVTDFSWRALHTSVEIGKKLTSLFYDRPSGKSYYIGCSLGGRQGIGNAEKFPNDFDGIVAGAPAVDFNSLYSWRASFYTITGDTKSPDFISPDTWKTTIHNEVLRQCDYIDGVTDGIIEDPILCYFDTEPLLCGNNNETTTDCLSAAQLKKVKTIFDDYLWPNGTLLYPRMNPGSELLAADGLYSGQAYSPSADWFKYVVLGQPSWNPATYTVDDASVASRKNPAGINTWPSSLSAFQDRGGKVLSYHGQQDQQISSLNSVRFWKHLASGMNYNWDQMDAFFRLIRIPGMSHCGGGPGAWTIGQGGTPPSYGIPFDKDHNALAAVVDWVEKGVAPDHIVGTKFVNDSVDAGIMYQHRHCRYPYRSTYAGVGNPLAVESWHCINFGVN
ncbi:tannase and feruloyl esterase [Xylariaceae sp. AK1471]|nr:tannase and feruloyl esterase [Xylariaceae sp. AK1471]